MSQVQALLWHISCNSTIDKPIWVFRIKACIFIRTKPKKKNVCIQSDLCIIYLISQFNFLNQYKIKRAELEEKTKFLQGL